MKNILEKNGNLDNYDKERTKIRNNNLLKKETFTKRFFDNDKKTHTNSSVNIDDLNAMCPASVRC